ncbi:TPA: hypothetical protein N0F65_010470 [Lagenidium giganteum]|uniref:Uncharacterized protein n=1 Tax=Lagenidium giganteum TaxID=4803 RepID=A0AAV2YF17_9STRA|nr:TPA: hypothetical protein N0F65_010470 [Lagenidium giganteum]
MTLVHENFPHLSTVEWDALKRLAVAVGDTLVTSLLCERAGPKSIVPPRSSFSVVRLRRCAPRNALQTTRQSSAMSTAGRVKLDVSTYSRSDRESCGGLLRWSSRSASSA